MTFVEKKERILIPRYPSEDSIPNRKRSDGRMKTYESIRDMRAWKQEEWQRFQYLLELMYDERKEKSINGRVIPLPLLVDIACSDNWNVKRSKMGQRSGKGRAMMGHIPEEVECDECNCEEEAEEFFDHGNGILQDENKQKPSEHLVDLSSLLEDAVALLERIDRIMRNDKSKKPCRCNSEVKQQTAIVCSLRERLNELDLYKRELLDKLSPSSNCNCSDRATIVLGNKLQDVCEERESVLQELNCALGELENLKNAPGSETVVKIESVSEAEDDMLIRSTVLITMVNDDEHDVVKYTNRLKNLRTLDKRVKELKKKRDKGVAELQKNLCWLQSQLKQATAEKECLYKQYQREQQQLKLKMKSEQQKLRLRESQCGQLCEEVQELRKELECFETSFKERDDHIEELEEIVECHREEIEKLLYFIKKLTNALDKNPQRYKPLGICPSQFRQQNCYT